MKHYRVQFRHPDSKPLHRKYWYYMVERNGYMTEEENIKFAFASGMTWFYINVLFASPLTFEDPRKYFSEIKEVK